MSLSIAMPSPNAAAIAATGQSPALSGPSAEKVGGMSSLVNAEASRDSILVQKAAAGEREAFRQLFERYQRPIAALVGRMVSSPDDVDDILQEVFLRAWKGLPNFRGDAQFSTWLYRIAVNTAIKYRSRRKNDNAPLVPLYTEDENGNATSGLEALPADVNADPARGGDPLRAVQRREEEAMIRKAVQALPEKQRSVVLLHYFEGRSCEEISGIVGCSLGTVWSRLHYACKRLRGVLTGGTFSETLFDGEAQV